MRLDTSCDQEFDGLRLLVTLVGSIFHPASGCAVVMCLTACSGRVIEFSNDSQGGARAAGGYLQAGSPSAATGGISQMGQGGAYGAGGSSLLSSSVGGTSPCSPARWVLANQVINARDLGGVPLSDRRASACGKLYRGGPLSNLTQEGCAAFDALGIRTIIDLRIDSERSSVPDSPCVLAQSSTLWAPLPVPYSLTPAQYIADLNTYSSIVAAFEAFGDATSYPIYFHCTYGRDRTGVLAAVILLALGASREDVLSEYQLTALSGLYVPPDSLTAVLDDIERRGGIEAYLTEAGVTSAALAVLRSEATGF